jgi:transposase InsO family protein
MARQEVPVSVRRVIVEADPATMNVAEFCRLHGVSTWFFWDLRRRHRLEGDVVLYPKSRAPRHPAGRTPVEVEDAIVAMRKELDDTGLDSGPASIAFHLRELPGLPSESTIWRILTARGLIVAQPAKAPKHSGRSWTAGRANECWALDDTGWSLADGTPVKILNVLDDHSRYCVASTAMLHSCTGAAALAVLAAAAVFLGWPARFWSDNARAFKSALATALAPLGVTASHPRPYHPQGNGKIERFHQTVQKWLARQPAAATVAELQAQLDRFRHLYNTQRPHRALDRRFPADVWTNAPKTGPAARPLGTTTAVYDTVVHGGHCFAGPYAISITTAYHRQRALTVITGTACHVFIDGQLVRRLTLNPDRRIQPIYHHLGRPTATERKDPRHA